MAQEKTHTARAANSKYSRRLRKTPALSLALWAMGSALGWAGTAAPSADQNGSADPLTTDEISKSPVVAAAETHAPAAAPAHAETHPPAHGTHGADHDSHGGPKPDGFRAGAFLFLPSVTLKTGYDDNPLFLASKPVETAIYSATGALTVEREWGAHTLGFDGAIGQVWAEDGAVRDEPHGAATLRGALNFENHWRLRASLGVEYAAEFPDARNGIDIDHHFEPYRDPGRVQRIPLRLAAGQRLDKTFVDAEVAITHLRTRPIATVGGDLVAQDFRNGIEGNAAIRAGYRLTPETGVFLRASRAWDRYDDEAADREGWNLDAGVDFEWARLLIGQAALGYQERRFASGEIVGAWGYRVNLHWTPAAGFGVDLGAEREIKSEVALGHHGETEVTPILHDGVHLHAHYAPLERLVLGLALRLERAETERGLETEQAWALGLDAAYALSKNFKVTAEWEREAASSPEAGRIVRNVAALGLVSSY